MILGLPKTLARLLVLGGLGAGGWLAYRRLTRGAPEPSDGWSAGTPPTPAPPQDIRDLLPILACPNCKGPLRLSDDEQQLICDQCKVAYAIEDGIPVLLPDSGKPIS